MDSLIAFKGVEPLHMAAAPGEDTDIFPSDFSTTEKGPHRLVGQIQLFGETSVVHLMRRKRSGNTKATGWIKVVAGADLADTDDFTLDDGTNPAVNFEYNSSGGITGDYAIPFTAARTVEYMRDATLAAIQAAIDADDLDMEAVADPEDVSKILLTSNTDSEDANVAATEAVTDAGFEISGMDGWVEDGEVLIPLGEATEAEPFPLTALIHGDYTYNLQLDTDAEIELLELAYTKA
jgi:hypothetical protein